MPNGGKGGGTVQLVIPYFSGDQGFRPLPSAYPYWMCHAIKIDGSPYAGQLFSPGQTVNLTVDVINIGTLTVTPVVLFFWAPPTTNFTFPPATLIGLVSPSPVLAMNALTTTSPVVWPIPAGTPEHICLIAEVTFPADPAPTDLDAIADRHFGQQNVYLLSAAPGAHIQVRFMMINNGATAARFRLEATHVLVNHHALHHIVGEHAILREAEGIELMPCRSDARRNRRGLHVDLAAGEQLEVEFNALVPRDATRGSSIIVELAQYGEDSHQPVGGLGVVVNVT
jgi:hypothetical protein